MNVRQIGPDSFVYLGRRVSVTAFAIFPRAPQ